MATPRAQSTSSGDVLHRRFSDSIKGDGMKHSLVCALGLAIKSRAKVFNDAAASNSWVTAANLPLQGIDHIAAQGKHFQWVLVEYGPYKRAAKVPLIE
jgi:hypothetical protein